MDGKARYIDNIFMERLWRTVKYEEVYLKAYSNGREAKDGDPLPLPFVQLIFVISAGNRRDILRLARDLLRYHQGQGISEVTERIWVISASSKHLDFDQKCLRRPLR